MTSEKPCPAGQWVLNGVSGTSQHFWLSLPVFECNVTVVWGIQTELCVCQDA